MANPAVPDFRQLRDAIADALRLVWDSSLAAFLEGGSLLGDDPVAWDNYIAGYDWRKLARAFTTHDILRHFITAYANGKAQAAAHIGMRWYETAPEARAYAEARAAEMVGMQRIGGKLVPNPSARWAITPATREDLRNLVVEAMTTRLDRPGMSYLDLKHQIETLPGFSGIFGDYRAEMIARSELAIAANSGTTDLYDKMEVHRVKVLDNPTCKICGKVADTIQTVQWAKDNPIGHPHCIRAFQAIVEG